MFQGGIHRYSADAGRVRSTAWRAGGSGWAAWVTSRKQTRPAQHVLEVIGMSSVAASCVASGGELAPAALSSMKRK